MVYQLIESKISKGNKMNKKIQNNRFYLEDHHSKLVATAVVVM